MPVPEPVYTEPDTFKSVAIVYMMAEELGDSDKDINELIRGKASIPEDCKVIIYRDEAGKPEIYQLDAWNGKRLWKVYEQEEDSTDPACMLNTLKDITKSFPARHYGLTLWSHGSGWIVKRRTIGKDNNPHTGREMNIPDLRVVLEQVPHMDYVFFDACFMQSVEVAYELKDVADWIIGSPAEIPGPGAPYNLIAEALCTGDAKGIVDGYNKAYPTNDYPGVLLSAVRSDKMEGLAKATKTHIQKLFGDKREQPTGTIQRYSDKFSAFTYCYDMNDAMFHLLPGEEYEEWSKVFDEAVPPVTRRCDTGKWFACWYRADTKQVATLNDPEHYGGISIYIPEHIGEIYNKNADLQLYKWYEAAGWDLTGW